MPNFIDKLALTIQDRAESLRTTLLSEATRQEKLLQELVGQHWHDLPPGTATGGHQRPAFAVDGSLRRANLANGAYLFAGQALFLGEGKEETLVEVEILRGSTDKSTVERFADLLLQWLEVSLARQHVGEVPRQSVIFLDGALYGQLPQLYPLTLEEMRPLPEEILKTYLELFRQCRERQVLLISVAKTSREATHSKIWQRAGDIVLPLEIPDSEMIYRWTGDKAGYSTPVLLGQWGFTRGSQELLTREEVSRAPAIVSFFVRLADFDDAMRVDVPAYCVGSDQRLGEVDGEILDLDSHDIAPVLQVLASDYGGLEVYNALLYTADREVRLGRKMMNRVYLKLIADILGCEVRLDRSERRF